ncbi:hypothetical protein HDU80_006178 [Chytriomyces hyalinus]|nr:hypothetical protein HDU80_006178 [Chytriomyces hyalinus]
MDLLTRTERDTHSHSYPRTHRTSYTPPPSPQRSKDASGPSLPAHSNNNIVASSTRASTDTVDNNNNNGNNNSYPAALFSQSDMQTHPLLSVPPSELSQLHHLLNPAPRFSSAPINHTAFLPVQEGVQTHASNVSAFNELAFLNQYQLFQQQQHQMATTLPLPYGQPFPSSSHPDMHALNSLTHIPNAFRQYQTADYLFHPEMYPVGVSPSQEPEFFSGSEYLEDRLQSASSSVCIAPASVFNTSSVLDFASCASPASFHSNSASPVPIGNPAHVNYLHPPAPVVSTASLSWNDSGDQGSLRVSPTPTHVFSAVEVKASPNASNSPKMHATASRSTSVRHSPLPPRRAAAAKPSIRYNEPDSDEFSDRSSSPQQSIESSSWSQVDSQDVPSCQKTQMLAIVANTPQTSSPSGIYNKWTAAEDNVLRAAIARVTKNNASDVAGKWVRVAQLVPNRTPIQCSARWTGALNSDIVRGKWTASEDALLVTAVECERARVSRVDACDDGTLAAASDADLNWQRISACVPGRTGVQCAARYQEALDPVIRKGKWLAEEDALLRDGILAHGKSWVKIAAAIPNRTQRQCRTRWLQIFPKLKDEEKRELERLSGADIHVNEKIKKKKKQTVV